MNAKSLDDEGRGAAVTVVSVCLSGCAVGGSRGDIIDSEDDVGGDVG